MADPSLIDALRQYIRDASPGGALNPEMTPEGTRDAAALATTPIPVVGDIAGLAADAHMYATQPEERNWTNYGLSAAGLLPFFPSAVMARALRKADDIEAPSSPASILRTEEGEPLRVFHSARTNFDRFEPQPGKAMGHHFGTAQAAEDALGTGIGDAGARTIPAHLALKNPLDVPFDTGFIDPHITLDYMDAWANQTDRMGNLVRPELAETIGRDARELLKRDKLTMQDVQKMLEKRGYDGMSYANTAEDAGSTSYIAFDNSQIVNPMSGGSELPMPAVLDALRKQ
jgi:hypothetical protein